MASDCTPAGLFRQIEATARPLMEGWQGDLKTDGKWLEANPGVPFVHITRKTGTHIFALPKHELLVADSPTPHLFGTARPSEVYRQVEEMLEEQMRHSAVLCMVFDGQRLKRMSMADAVFLYRQARLRALSRAASGRRQATGDDRAA